LVYGYDPETKQQSPKRDSPLSPRPKFKSMLFCLAARESLTRITLIKAKT